MKVEVLHDMDNEGFAQLIRQLQSLGFDEETASNYAVLIGDTPCYDEDGNLVVMENDGTVLARFRFPYFDREDFGNLVEEIQDQGIEFYTAGHYAIVLEEQFYKCELQRDKDGMVLVIEDGKTVARLKPLKYFGME